MILLFADALPDADTIRRKAEEVLDRPEYASRDVAEESGGLWTHVTDALRWCMEQLTALSNMMGGLPVGLQWVIKIGLVILLLLITAHIIYTLLRSMRVPERSPDSKSRGGRERDPRELERLAEQAREDSDYIEAVRLLFRAAILRLENAEQRMNRPGTTNRELLRRYQATPVHAPLQQFVTVIDTKWYGGAECGPADYDSCQNAHDNVRNLARRVQQPVPVAPTMSPRKPHQPE